MKIVISSLLMLIIGICVFGQQHTENKADQTLRGSGRVNPSTLGMEIDIPLGSYPGRGINVPISLSYSSKVWRMEYTSSMPGGVVTGGCRALNAARFAETTASGWTTSLSVPYIEYVGKDNLFNDTGFPWGADPSICDPNAPPSYAQNAYVRRLTIHLPSGETHELRTDDTAEVYPPESNCFPPTNQGCAYNDPSLQHNWNRTYYATDGSNIKYVEDSNTNTYRLLMPDGSYYDFSSTTGAFNNSTARKAIKYTDRNGNFTSYDTQTGALTDTLGKTLTAPIGTTAPVSPTTQTYTMPGMTGTYKFKWKQLKGDSAAESGLTDFSQNLRYLGDRYHAGGGNGYNWATQPAGTFLFGSQWDSWVMRQTIFNPVVLTEVELPTGQSYKFTYDVYGRIERIYYPTGGEERFVYNVIAPLAVSDSENVSDQTNFGVTNRKLYPTAGQSANYEWNYSVTYVAPSGYKINTTAPDGTINSRILHRGNGNCTSCSLGTFGYDNGLAGMPYEELNYSNTGELVTRKLTSWILTTLPVIMGYPNGQSVPHGRYGTWHPRVTQEETIIYDETGNGVSATTRYEYEGDLNLRETPVLVNKSTQYAFVAIGNGGSSAANLLPDPDDTPDPNPTPIPTPTPATLTPIKINESTYLINDATIAQTVRDVYKNQNMVGLVTASVTKDGTGTIVSRDETRYDESGYSPGYRGNPTTSRVWDSTKGIYSNTSAYISTRAKFDAYGNRYEAIDAKGNSTITTFDSTHHTFPVQVTSAVPDPSGQNGSNTAFVTTATFDFTTGLPLTTTDANGLETRVTYDPVTLRALNTKTFYQNNQVGSQSETVYHDETNNYWTKSRSQIDTDKWAESITYFDGLGRAYKTEQIDSQGNIFVEKEFDAQGRVKRVTNPFRLNETKQWTTNVYDEASRIKEIILPDNSKVKTDYGVSITGVIGITKQITDQAGEKRKGITDALGRMIRVIEDPDGQNLSTDYTFDTLGNLRKTVQGEQSRYFSYDSLGRLLRAKQPEQEVNTSLALPNADSITGNNQWSAAYSYDDNGNTLTTTDARGITVTGVYDNFNRIKSRDYSDSTPDVSFFYDGRYLDSNDVLQIASGSVKGQTTGIKSSVSKTNYTSFNNLGQLLTHQQITDSQIYSTAYTYNLSGAVIEETYPSGRVVKNVLNNDGELSMTQSKKNANAGFFTYAGNITYNASGAVEKMRLGNGRWETAQYNSRLQITQIGLGVTDQSQDLLKLEYSYGNSTQNNGSLREQKITVPTVGQNPGFTAIQTYSYDDLNRLQSAAETVSGNQTWRQTFLYDRYGNRRLDANNTTTLAQSNNITNPNIDPATNRFAAGQNYFYDKSGNLIQDAEGKEFLYDGENHQKEVKDVYDNTIGQYLYDGEGKRVKKISNTENTVFVYNGGGKLVAEYSTALANTPQVSYLTQDHLGSPRVVTNANGAVINRKDFTAFGEENYSQQRTSALGYTSQDDLRKGYTGYEKDDESGLDFAQARYYNSSHGRFTSIDPLTASADTKNPQTFNRYSYVLNSPYKFTDPLGLLPQSFSGGGFCSASQSSCEEGEEITTQSQEEYRRRQQEQERKKQQNKPKPPPKKKTTKKKPAAKPAPKPPQQTAPQKEAPRPTSATVTVDFVGTETGTPDGKNPNYISGRAIMTFTVLDQFGNPFEGTVTETVTSPNSNVVINKDPVKLVNGQFSDFVDGGGVTWTQPTPMTPTDQANGENNVENTATTTRQTATFTVTGPGTNASLTIVQERVLTNVDSRTNQINPPRNGTTFRFYAQPLKVTTSP